MTTERRRLADMAPIGKLFFCYISDLSGHISTVGSSRLESRQKQGLKAVPVTKHQDWWRTEKMKSRGVGCAMLYA